MLFITEISSYFIAMLKQRGNGFRNITSRYFIYFDEACLLMILSFFSGFGEGEVWVVVGEACSETREDDLVLDCSL